VKSCRRASQRRRFRRTTEIKENAGETTPVRRERSTRLLRNLEEEKRDGDGASAHRSRQGEDLVGNVMLSAEVLLTTLVPRRFSTTTSTARTNGRRRNPGNPSTGRTTRRTKNRKTNMK